MFWTRIFRFRNNKQCFGEEYADFATTSHVLGTFCVCFGHVLVMFRACFGHGLGMFWACFGHVPDMFWACFGHVSGMFQACDSNVSDVINFKIQHFSKISKFRPVLKYLVFHAEFESEVRFA